MVSGEAGTAGEPGYKGFQGAAGGRGAPGVPGRASSITGPGGARGNKGFKGEQGFPGSDGGNGYEGQTGARGFKGVKGPMGETGPSGMVINGEEGFKGQMGATGMKGLKGHDGLTGPSGPAAYERLWSPESPSGWAYHSDEVATEIADYDSFTRECEAIVEEFAETVGDVDRQSGAAGEAAEQVNAFRTTSTRLLNGFEAQIGETIEDNKEKILLITEQAYTSAWDLVNDLRAEVEAKLGSP